MDFVDSSKPPSEIRKYLPISDVFILSAICRQYKLPTAKENGFNTKAVETNIKTIALLWKSRAKLITNYYPFADDVDAQAQIFDSTRNMTNSHNAGIADEW